MILFVFEGERQEPRIFQTIEYLFFRRLPEKEIHVAYCSHIISLFNKMQQLDAFGGSSDIVQVLKEDVQKRERKSEDDLLLLRSFSDEYSQIFLFFDYDLQKKENLAGQNAKVKALLNYFCDETDKGKLYINYPMVESIRYFKCELPDNNFYKYKASPFMQGKFKEKAASVSFYKDMRFIAFDFNPKKKRIKIPRKEEHIANVYKNWKTVKELNVKKANYICCGKNEYPEKKADISQKRIFKGQQEKFMKGLWKRIAVLNSFPLFLYEFFRQTERSSYDRENP